MSSRLQTAVPNVEHNEDFSSTNIPDYKAQKVIPKYTGGGLNDSAGQNALKHLHRERETATGTVADRHTEGGKQI